MQKITRNNPNNYKKQWHVETTDGEKITTQPLTIKRAIELQLHYLNRNIKTTLNKITKGTNHANN